MLQTSLRYLAVVAFAANFSAASALADATSASWDKVKSSEVLTKLKEKGVFLDLMQWRAALIRGDTTAVPLD